MKKFRLQAALLFISIAAFAQGDNEKGGAYNTRYWIGQISCISWEELL